MGVIRTAVTGWQQALAGPGIGSDPSRMMFVRLATAVTDGASAAQGARTAAVDDAGAALAGIAVGPTVLALLAAVLSGLAIRTRLREYH